MCYLVTLSDSIYSLLCTLCKQSSEKVLKSPDGRFRREVMKPGWWSVEGVGALSDI